MYGFAEDGPTPLSFTTYSDLSAAVAANGGQPLDGTLQARVVDALYVWDASSGAYVPVGSVTPYLTLAALNAAVPSPVVGQAYPYVTGYLVWTATGWLGDIGVVATLAEAQALTGIADGCTAVSLADGPIVRVGGVWAPDALVRINLPVKNACTVVQFGDSLAVTGGAAYSVANSLSPRMRYIGAYGHPGATSATILTYFDAEIAPLQPTYIVLNAGTNDARTGVATATMLANIGAIIDKAIGIGAKIVVCGLPPGDTGKETAMSVAHAAIASYCAKRGVIYVDKAFSEMRDVATGTTISAKSCDGLHPTYEVEAVAGSIIAAHIAPTIPDNRFANLIYCEANANHGGLLANPLCITDTNADGVADNWGVPSGAVVGSLVARDDGLGNWQRYTATNLSASQSNNAYFGRSISPGLYYFSGEARVVDATPKPNHFQGSLTITFRDASAQITGSAVLFDRGNLLTSDIRKFSGFLDVRANTTQLYITNSLAVEAAQSYPVSGKFDVSRLQIWAVGAGGIS